LNVSENACPYNNWLSVVVFGHVRKVQWISCAGQLDCPVVSSTQLLLVHPGMFTHGGDLRKEGKFENIL